MAQPPPYVRTFSFTDYTANYPSTPQPGVRLDTEYDAIRTTLDAIRVNLALIQRDDGALANNSVGPDQISAALTIGLRTVSTWTAGHTYVVNDGVWVSGYKLYRCVIAHTASGSFATDLAASKWELVLDYSLYTQAAVNAAIAAGLITVGVDITTFAGKAAANVFTGTNTFQNTTTFSATPVSSIGAATAANDYYAFKPTDYGAGKPGVFVRKKAAATAWALEIDDGLGGTGSLDLPTATTVGGVTPASQAYVDAAARHARNVALTSR